MCFYFTGNVCLMLTGDNKNLQTLPGVMSSFLLEQLDVKHLQAAILRVKMLD